MRIQVASHRNFCELGCPLGRKDKGGYNAHACLYRPRWCDDPRGRPGYGSTPRPPLPVLYAAGEVGAQQQHHGMSLQFNGPVPNDGLWAPSEVFSEPILARVEIERPAVTQAKPNRAIAPEARPGSSRNESSSPGHEFEFVVTVLLSQPFVVKQWFGSLDRLVT